MDKMNELLAALLFYRANFHNLHWNAIGHGFDTAHKNFTSDYYEMCLDSADEVAEMILRMGGTCPNYREVMAAVEKSEKDFVIIETAKLYQRDEIVQLSDVMLKDICGLIVEALASSDIQAPENVGIKSALEAIHNTFDLQARYINARRLPPTEESAPVVTAPPVKQEEPKAEEEKPAEDSEENN